MRNALFVSLLFFASYMSANIVNLDAKGFKALIDKKDGVILDTRTTGEYNSGHIEGAVLINLQSPDVQKTLLALPKNKPLYLYCFSGARSISVANFLLQNGYTKIFNLQRGIMDWSQNGYSLVTEKSAVVSPQSDKVSFDLFKSTTSSAGVVLVDFYALWCAPCKEMMPMMDKLNKEYSGKLKLLKVNVDASKELARSENIQSVPYIVLYKNGKSVFTRSGAITEAELRKVIDSNLK